jgi:phage protein D
MFLRCYRNLPAGMNQEVKTSSWDAKQQKLVTSVKTLSGSGGTVTYEYRGANLKQDQADKHSTNKAEEHGRHELTIDLEMAGDTSVDPSSQKLTLSGTGTDFDQTYDIDNVHHVVGDDGYRMMLDCKSKKSGRSVS